VKGPHIFTRANVEAADIPWRHERRLIPSETPIHPGGADNDDVAADDRWGYESVMAPLERSTQPLRQIDTATFTKVRVRPAGLRVERIEIGGGGPEEDALRHTIGPEADTPRIPSKKPSTFQAWESKVHNSAPVAASRALTRLRGLIVYNTPSMTIGVLRKRSDSTPSESCNARSADGQRQMIRKLSKLLLSIWVTSANFVLAASAP
jgi:hypothetical protein